MTRLKPVRRARSDRESRPEREPRPDRDSRPAPAPEPDRGSRRAPGFRVEFPPPERGIFVNRTLNLRGIRAIGYDMDYTLIHYHVVEWEGRAYAHLIQRFLQRNWPVEHLRFDPLFAIRGLVVDRHLGNIVKPNRFGYVKQASHGTRPIPFEEQRRIYARVLVDPRDERFAPLTTLFSLSETCLYAQLVDLLDEKRIPEVIGYADLQTEVRRISDDAHMEGTLKAEIRADPDRFVTVDRELVLTLLDQRRAGKKILLITNSDWGYTRAMLHYALDRFLGGGASWRDLFDVVIVSVRKPGFFSGSNPLFEVVNDEGLLKPAIRGLSEGGVFLGGDASLVEAHLGMTGEEILYVGDHITADVYASKGVLRWRTALVIRELEEEIAARRNFHEDEEKLAALMDEKERLEYALCQFRIRQQRAREKYGPPGEPVRSGTADSIRARLAGLDERIAPLARASREIANPRWGLLMRAGNDKSQFARQVEAFADIYMSRVSNLLYQTPFAYLRSPRGSLPHDPA